jgi:hypothetical protein
MASFFSGVVAVVCEPVLLLAAGAPVLGALAAVGCDALAAGVVVAAAGRLAGVVAAGRDTVLGAAAPAAPAVCELVAGVFADWPG